MIFTTSTKEFKMKAQLSKGKINGLFGVLAGIL
jgi:hypothetical protein